MTEGLEVTGEVFESPRQHRVRPGREPAAHDQGHPRRHPRLNACGPGEPAASGASLGPLAPGGVHRRRRHGRRRDLLAARRGGRGGRRGRVDLVPDRRRRRRCCRATRSPSSAPGTRRPAACSSTSRRGFGDGHVTGVIAWLLLAANAIVTGDGRGVVRQLRQLARRRRQRRAGSRSFAVLVVVVMTVLNVVGSQAVARAQTSSSSSSSASSRCSPSPRSPTWTPTCSPSPATRRSATSWPASRSTFFAFLGFGVITFTAKDLADPARQLPRPCTSRSGIATVDLRRGRPRRVRHADASTR